VGNINILADDLFCFVETAPDFSTLRERLVLLQLLASFHFCAREFLWVIKVVNDMPRELVEVAQFAGFALLGPISVEVFGGSDNIAICISVVLLHVDSIVQVHVRGRVVAFNLVLSRLESDVVALLVAVDNVGAQVLNFDGFLIVVINCHVARLFEHHCVKTTLLNFLGQEVFRGGDHASILISLGWLLKVLSIFTDGYWWWLGEQTVSLLFADAERSF